MTTTTTLSATAQRIIDQAQAACAGTTEAALAELCVSAVHESPRTIVLQGNLLIVQTGTGILYTDNPYIWQAVDGLKNQGYTLTSVQLAGQGSQGNPHDWYIVMSK